MAWLMGGWGVTIIALGFMVKGYLVKIEEIGALEAKRVEAVNAQLADRRTLERNRKAIEECKRIATHNQAEADKQAVRAETLERESMSLRERHEARLREILNEGDDYTGIDADCPDLGADVFTDRLFGKTP